MAASPLPAPTPVQMAPLDLLALAAANATNATNPDIVAGVASSAKTVSDAATNSQAATQLAQVQDTIDTLKGYAPKQQAKLWDTLTPPQQAQFRAAGYKPPSTGGSSFWGDIANVAEAPYRDVIKPALGSQPVHDVFNAAGAPLRAVQHGFRAAQRLGDMAQIAHGDYSGTGGGGPGASTTMSEWGTALRSLVSPSDWSRAWKVTTNGETYLDPAYVKQARDKWGPQVFDIAHELATGKTVNDLLAAQANNPQAQQALLTQIQSPDVKQAVAYLNAAHVSPGRSLVGPGFIARHPVAGNAVSGAVDATYDWYADPLARAGVALKGYGDARYVVGSGSNVQHLYDRYSSVQEAMGQIAEKIKAGNITGAGGLFDLFPKQQMAMERLAASQADTQEKVLEWYKNEANVADLIKGSPIDTPWGPGGVLPHLTPVGRLRLAAKGELRKTIDWAADRPAMDINVAPEDVGTFAGNTPTGVADKFVTGMGRTARRLTTLVPQHKIFVPSDPNSAHVLRDLASQFLPASSVNEIVGEYLKDPDLGAKWRIYRSLMVQMGDAAGLRQDPDLWDAHISKFTSTEGRFYSTRGNDVISVDDQPMHVGVIKTHMSGGWLIPNFKDLYLQGQKAGVTNRLTQGINAGWMDAYMGRWRPLVLAHLGFAPRVGGEEAGGFIAREGLGAYMRGVAANVALKNRMRLENPEQAVDKTTADLVDNEVAGVHNMLTSHLPARVVDKITDGKSLAKAYYSDLMDRSFRQVATRLTTGKYETDGIQPLLDHGVLMPDQLTAMHGYDPDQVGQIDGGRVLKMKVKGKIVEAEVAPSGDYRMYDNKDPLFKQMWYRSLHQVANDDWARGALPVWKPKTLRIQAIADKLMDDPKWKDSILSVQDRSGRQLALGQVTERQLAEAHAEMIVNHVGSLIRSPNGKVIGDLATFNDPENSASLPVHLLKHGRPPSMAALDSIPRHLWPTEVQGPETVPLAPTHDMIRRSTNYLFEKYIGPQINWISRQPMFIHHYATSRQAYAQMARVWTSQGLSDEAVEDLVHNNAMERAVNQMMPYIHNPELRSQMSVLTRNVAPFWFAQEQFYKRWARTMAYSPATFRKAQLLSNGLRHSGFIQNDPTSGQSYFVYPGSHLVQDVLSHTLFWLHGQLPISPDLLGQTNQLSPGLTRGIGGPSFGPLAVIPMNAIKAVDPTFTSAIDKVEGKQAGGQPFLQSLLPTTVYRAMQAAWPSGFAAQQYASAQMQAIQMVEANGHGISTPAINQVGSTTIPNPKPGDYVLQGGSGSAAYVFQPDGQWRLNTPGDLQQLKTRVSNYARIIFMTRLMFGFAAPASPEVQFRPSNLNSDLQALMTNKKLTVDQALSTFMLEHPDATPYTVFQSQTSTGGFLPATDAAMNFLSTNGKLTSDHKLSATYFIPAPAAAGKFSLEAYQEQMAAGLRQHKDPAAFYNEIVYQSAARVYYKAENYKFQLLADHSAPTTQVNNAWTQWSEQFLQANPIFADQMSSNGQLKRQQIMDDVGAAIRDGSAPKGTQTTALGELYNTYVTWVTATNTFGNPNLPHASAQQKMRVDEQYATWLQTFVKDNPGVQPLVDRVIRPDLSQALTALAAQGVTVTL